MLFVYRSHYEGPWSKLVRSLPDRSVLGFFRRGWDEDDPEAWLRSTLGADVYGLDTVFTRAREHGLPAPATIDELREHLRRHLYVEGPSDEYIRLDEHSLRVRTDDDEVELAYFFFDDDALAAHPDRLAYVTHAGALPGDIIAEAAGDHTTFAVFLTYYDGASLDCPPPFAFPGLTLPELPAHLRATAPDAGTWPAELVVLRSLVGPDDASIEPALQRCNTWPGFNLNADPLTTAAAEPLTGGRRPELSRLRADTHVAQLAMHCSEFFGFQQWYLFDTVWADAHPELASSLLRYATGWDPLA
ncbi:hypothetical protein [Dactylosporangium matsuzakiense]|uniref:Uncharacterized protein n=1 Tax=Dactylosporangium matsuzakiense TaxID=53360 RepID=A0A9W6NM74_9ACTN|nr:hypothetical protein [Dactylosporangium matsuzakiense]UWZ47539.1 hypothetical protein Dmats_14700 [Dactylosporangium matsuzakiense]GLL01632.1 hypothetical protein GCM10017581_033740 [Dactylosporangium matsuzakiense]